MYCPRCGQQQVSGDLRFCSRCGLPMNLISEILSNGGILPQLLELNKQTKIFTRRNGLIFSLFWFIFFLMILTPFWGIMDVEELAGMSAIIGVFGGLMIMLFSLFFLSKPVEAQFNQQYMQGESTIPANLSGHQTNQNALPPQQTQSAQEYVAPAQSWKAPDTGELVSPGSVTEGTTKLLKKDE